jgi:rhodanese-related sulfurtransferase
MEKLFEFVINHYILVSAFVALLAALALLEARRGGKKISSQQTISLLNQEKAVVVDIRDRKDYADGHIVDSLHIPLSFLKERIAELKKHEGKQIVVADKMGQHSAGAVKQLNAEGLNDVVRLSGGIAEWKGSNLPLKKEKSEGKSKNKGKANKKNSKRDSKNMSNDEQISKDDTASDNDTASDSKESSGQKDS